MNKTPDPTPAIEEITLEWIPQAMRRMMDQAMVRISLAQWQRLPMADRQLLARMAGDPATALSNFVHVLESALSSAAAGPMRREGAAGGNAPPPT